MKSCLWGWSFYRYSLAKDPFLIGYICFLATLSMMQVRHLRTQLINIQLRNRFRVHMVYECAWGSIPGECDLPKSLNWYSRLELRSQAQVRTHARMHTASAHTYSLLPLHSNKNKNRCTVIAHTKEPSLTECIIYLTRIPNGPSVTKRSHMQIRYNAIRNVFWSGFNMKIEQRHDKTNKMICTPSEDRSVWASTQSDQSFRCPPDATLGPKLPTERTAKTDQTWRMPRFIWVFAGRKGHFVAFVMTRLKMFLPRV